MVAAALALVPACGGKERLSADEFREKANAVCAEGSERVEARVNELLGDSEEVPTAEQLDELADLVAEEFEDQIHEIRELAPPEDLEDDVDDALDSAEEAVHGLEEQGGEIFQSSEDPFEDANAKLVALGLNDCGE